STRRRRPIGPERADESQRTTIFGNTRSQESMHAREKGITSVREDGEADLIARASTGRSNVFRDVFRFLSETKKWWLTPTLLCLLLFAALISLSGTAAAPFIYTLF